MKNIAKDIKTKEKVIKNKTKGSAGKAADRAKIVSVKVKDGIAEVKDKVKKNTNTADDRSPEQYATDEVTDKMHKAAEDVVIAGDKAVRKVTRKVDEKVKQKREDKKANIDSSTSDESLPQKFEAEQKSEKPESTTSSSAKSRSKQPVDEKKKPKQRKQTPPKTRGELTVKKPKAGEQNIKYAHSTNSKIKQTARSSANTKNTIKTADSTVKNVKKSEKVAKKSAQETAKTAKRAEETAKKTTKAIGKAIVEAGKATVAAVKGTETAVAVGGVPAVVVIIIICLLAAVGGTCFGIFLSNDKTTGSKMTMTQAISQLTTDYYTDLEEFKNNYDYDQYEVKTESENITIDWKTVLAVYAVKTTTSVDNAYEVATMDDTKYELLKNVMYDINPKSGQVATKSISIETVTTDKNGASIKKTTYETKKVLTVTIEQLSADEICKHYGFNTEQKSMLNELLSDEYSAMWDELINNSGAIILPNGSPVGSGKFIWPVAGDYTITSRFGTRVDPISGAVKTHGGTDIAAAQGTPIVAAADGTVIAAEWHNSYGYYVKIQHDGTYSTLYGHCSALLVSAGQTVKQGQMIAKVGSTGDSTGPHCHFEVIHNGIRVDALSFYD